MKFILKATTDERGEIDKRERLSIPFGSGIVLGSRADVRGRVLEPAGVDVTLRLDLDSSDGSRRNDDVTRTVPAGQTVELGAWRFGTGEHMLSVKGSTSPVTPNTDFVCEIHIS